MSMKRVVLCCVFLAAALPVFGKHDDPCGYQRNAEKFEIDLQTDRPLVRKELIDFLQCNRSVELESDPATEESKARRKRIEVLEGLALRDLQRLTDRLALLDKLEANGSSSLSRIQYADTRASISFLAPVVRMVDGKPVLAPTLFTELRASQKKKVDDASAEAKEAEAQQACGEDDAPVKLKDVQGVKRCIDVLSDALAANTLAAEGSSSRYLEEEATDLRRKIAAVQEKGVAIAAALTKDLAALRDKARKAEEDKVPDADRKKIADAIAEQEKAIALISGIATEPSARRHCRDDDNVSLTLEDAKSVQRCLDVLNDAISSAKFEAESPETKSARNRVGDLTAQLARIVDAARLLREATERDRTRLSGEASSDAGNMENPVKQARDALRWKERVPMTAAARPICGSAENYIVLTESDVVDNCISGLRREIAAAVDEMHHASGQDEDAAALADRLKQRRVRIIKRGVVIANRRMKDAAGLADKIAAAKDAKDRDPLVALKAEADADVVLLTEIAVDPNAEQACIDDLFAHLDITNTRFITRCLTALSRKVRDLRAADTRMMCKADRKLHREELARYEAEWARFEEAGRRMAVLRGQDLADATRKHDAATTDADKARYDQQQKVATADLDSLRKFVIIPNEDPQTEYADYEQWFMKMSGGFEYVGASNAFAKGFPQISATIGFLYPRSLIPATSSSWRYWGYGDYTTFTIALTNSGEAKPTSLPPIFASGSSTPASAMRPRALDEGDPATTTNSDTVVDNQLKRALEFELQSFHPIWRNDFQVENPRLRTTVGPMIIIGGRKLDDESFVHQRIYAGVRTARSPDTFADLLYGRTGGLRSHRLEARGQYAFPHAFKNNARLSVGAVGNFGFNKRKFESCEEASPHCRLEEKDVIKFYLSYDVDTTGLLSLLGLDQKPKPTTP